MQECTFLLSSISVDMAVYELYVMCITIIGSISNVHGFVYGHVCGRHTKLSF